MEARKIAFFRPVRISYISKRRTSAARSSSRNQSFCPLEYGCGICRLMPRISAPFDWFADRTDRNSIHEMTPLLVGSPASGANQTLVIITTPPAILSGWPQGPRAVACSVLHCPRAGRETPARHRRQPVRGPRRGRRLQRPWL